MTELFLYRLSRLQAVAVAPVGRLCQARYGISRREWRLLVVLARHGAMLSSELADQAQLDRARTSRIVTTLADMKLIVREVIPSDRRQARVSLTPRGPGVVRRVPAGGDRTQPPALAGTRTR